MTALTDLRAEVVPHVPGCPLPMVDAAILKAVIDFCIRSRAYRFNPAAITTVAGTADYTIADLPTGYEIAWLLSAELDDVPLQIAASGVLPLGWETETGAPSYALRKSATQIGLRVVPDSAGSLLVRLALRPSAAATTYPDELHALYQEGIAAGALARIWAQPKQAWTNMEMVSDARSRFEDAIASAEYRADRGFANAPARTALNLIGGR